MKIKKNILFILFAVDVILIIISQILLYFGEKDYLSDKDFVIKFNNLASETNFSNGQKEKIIKGLTNKMKWMGPREYPDNLIMVIHLVLVIPLITLHIFYFILLIVYRVKNKSTCCLIYINLFSLFPLIYPVIFSLWYIGGVIKPINLTEKDYTTNNIKFNKLIKDKINSLNWRAFELIMSPVLLLVSVIITIIVLIIIIIEKKKENSNSISTIESPLVN